MWKVAALDGNAGQNVGNVAIRQAFQFGGKILATRVDYALVLLETVGREIRSGIHGNCVIDLALNGNMQRQSLIVRHIQISYKQGGSLRTLL